MSLSSAASVDTRDMYIVHAVFRRELGLAPDLIRGVAGDHERAELIATHLDLVEEMLHRHHGGEDELLWPLLAARVGEQLHSLVELMQHQHEHVHRLSATVVQLRTRWRHNPDPELSERLAHEYDELNTVLLEHLCLEEQEVLPLVQRHISPTEWAKLGEEGRAHIPKEHRNVILGMFLHDGGDLAPELFFDGAPRLVRAIVPRLARRSYRRYAQRVYGRMPAVNPVQLPA